MADRRQSSLLRTGCYVLSAKHKVWRKAVRNWKYAGYDAAKCPSRDAGKPQAGRIILNSLPFPGVLDTSMLPPCAMATARTRLSPSPQPAFERLSSHLKNRSNIFFRSCFDMPTPSSRTDTRMFSPDVFTPTLTLLPRSEYFRERGLNL